MNRAVGDKSPAADANRVAAAAAQKELRLVGRRLVGVLDRAELPGDKAKLGIVDNKRQIDQIELPVPAGADEVPFSYQLPWSLYDGQLHQLAIFVEGRQKAVRRKAVIADPAVLFLAANMGESQIDEENASEAEHEGATMSLQFAIMRALNVNSRALSAILERLQSAPAGAPVATAPSAFLQPVDFRERYGPLFAEALAHQSERPDILWFSIIDWHYRIQRPQHLAAHLARRGHRIFYISVRFGWLDHRGRFEIVSSPDTSVFEIRIKLPPPHPVIYSGFTPEQIRELRAAVAELCQVLAARSPVAIVQFPTWYEVAAGIPGVTLVHDCLDYVAGFSNVSDAAVEREEKLIEKSDLVVTTSAMLSEMVSSKRSNVVIRNAADVDFFAKDPGTEPLVKTRPIIGYFGAISDWYEMDWVVSAATKHPEWDFVLIGSTVGCDTTVARAMDNIKLLGEKPYAELPGYLHQFDVAIIPFKLTKLIQSTNPVKLYEYLSAGKPVVASPMPEVLAVGDVVSIAHDADEFEKKLANALSEDSDDARAARKAWTAQHTWRARADAYDEAIRTLAVRVSVVVLCHNNWSFTKACLDSLIAFSDYPNLEVIVVDNASVDETASELQDFTTRDRRFKVIRNETNLGFAGGNNVGIKEATGEVVVLLNNDTYVTRGWVRDLIRPLLLDSAIGMSGPLTNNIGNEQKLNIQYASMQEMRTVAAERVGQFTRRLFETNNLAFFCVAIRKDVLDKVGLLDEAYGVGFFEDDDYCRRVEKAGYRMVVVDDVFIHHHLAASFSSKFGAEGRQQQLDRNRKIYEAKWGPWRPHKYRSEQGFG